MNTLNDTGSLPVIRPREFFFAWGGDGATGYSSEGDVLVNQTSDGVDLSTIWQQAQAVMAAWNSKRSALASLISYQTTNPGDAIPQGIGGDHFEEASEFGEPTGLRAEPDALVLGYTFKDYDIASRFTWKFLRDASAEQVRSVIDRVLDADNRQTTGAILRRLFDPTQGANEFGTPVYGLYTGTDGHTPPPFAGQTFSPTTNHYLVSEQTSLDPGDLSIAMRQVTSKGFGIESNSRLIILCNPQEGEIIAQMRAGYELNGVESKYDFIPSVSSIPYLSTENIVGQIAPAEYGGLPVAGSYGPAWVIESHYLPAGYIAVVATGGPNSPSNPVAFRQHVNPAYQGLRIIPGRDQRYPLQDSFFARGYGTGVRYRGAACVVQIKASGAYEAPTWAWK